MRCQKRRQSLTKCRNGYSKCHCVVRARQGEERVTHRVALHDVVLPHIGCANGTASDVEKQEASLDLMDWPSNQLNLYF